MSKPSIIVRALELYRAEHADRAVVLERLRAEGALEMEASIESERREAQLATLALEAVRDVDLMLLVVQHAIVEHNRAIVADSVSNTGDPIELSRRLRTSLVPFLRAARSLAAERNAATVAYLDALLAKLENGPEVIA